jgi:hypothetical protein
LCSCPASRRQSPRDDRSWDRSGGTNLDWLFVSLVLYLSVIPPVPLVFLPRGRVFEQALVEAEAAGG